MQNNYMHTCAPHRPEEEEEDAGVDADDDPKSVM